MHHRHQRITLDEIITRFNYVLRSNQIFALFDQILIFTLKRSSDIQWISSYIDIPMGLHLFMINLHGQICLDEHLYEKLVLTTSRTNFVVEEEEETENKTNQSFVHLENSKILFGIVGIVQWILRLIRRLSTKSCKEFDSLEIFLDEINENELNRCVIEQILKVNIV